jgi:hypothetical protein
LLKKITILGISVVIILVIISYSISDNPTEKNNDELQLIVKGDVVMPSKVSRPGCEEMDRCYVPSIITTE